MNVELKHAHSTPQPDATAAMCARGDYMDESLVGKTVAEAMETSEKDMEELIEKLLRRGHFGVFEHPQAVFAVEGMSVVVERQITRHRHMSWDIQSMRYVNFEDAEAVIPDTVRNGDGEHEPALAEREYGATTELSYDSYQELVGEHDIPEEDARYVLPLGTKINATFSGNARSLMHLIGIRNAGNVQPETRELAKAVLEECKDWAPLTFDLYEEHVMNRSKLAP
jgi:thymidylate synthase (FAD)